MWSVLGGILIGASVLLFILDIGYFSSFIVFATGLVAIIFGKYKEKTEGKYLIWGVISYLGGIIMGASVLLLTLDIGLSSSFIVFVTGLVIAIFGKYKENKILKR